MTDNERRLTLRELLNLIIDYDDNVLMFKATPQPVSRGMVMAHLYKFDPSSPRGHGALDISNEASARARIKCPIYHNNEDKEIIINNFLCTCGLLFIFPAQVQGDKYKYLENYYGTGVCPCSTCVHWHKMLHKCTY